MNFEGKKINLEKILKKYHINCAYIFGSQATGKAHKKSDFDIAVRYEKKLSLEVLLCLNNDLSKLLGGETELVDLSSAPLTLQFRIFKQGKLLHAKNPKAELMLKTKALCLYYDYKYYYDRYTKMEMQRILSKAFV